MAYDTETLMPSSAGVCWADVPEEAAEQCFACADGEVCVQRSATQLVCVSPAVCDALWQLGAMDVCRYADKSHYDQSPLPEPTGPCPTPSYLFCGGACGACGPAARCTGRSPSHPFGICQLLSQVGSAMFDTCSIEGGAVVSPCPDAYSICGVFATAGADQPDSELFGLCMMQDACLERANALPGGYLCFDPSGQQLN